MGTEPVLERELPACARRGQDSLAVVGHCDEERLRAGRGDWAWSIEHIAGRVGDYQLQEDCSRVSNGMAR